MNVSEYMMKANPTRKDKIDMYVLLKKWIDERIRFLGGTDGSVEAWEKDAEQLREEINASKSERKI